MLILTVLSFALASEPTQNAGDKPLFVDGGAHPAQDPYVSESNNFLTAGTFSGFRAVYVKPDEFAGSLKPTADAETHTADLPIENPTSSWAEVDINGERAARIGPLATAHVKNVKAGRYDLTFTLSNGRKIQVSQKTTR